MSMVEKLMRPEILALSSYKVQDQDCKIKLDAMENPYCLPEDLQDKWSEQLKKTRINLYPDSEADALQDSLRDFIKVPESVHLLLGNGSDELIQIIMLALNKPGAKVLSVEPSFVMYQMIATIVGMQYIGIELRQDFSLDEEKTLKAIAIEAPELIFVANPNNPTGNLFDRPLIEKIIQAAPGIVVVDEAYFSFNDESFIPELTKYQDKLLIMRTVSKLGLAGLRLGLLLGHPDWITQFSKVRLPYNINSLTQLSADFLLKNSKIFHDQARKIRNEREKLFSALATLPEIRPYPSEANFILFKVPDADKIHQQLGADGILVKNLNSSSDKKLTGCLRVSIGTKEENEIFITGLKKILANNS